MAAPEKNKGAMMTSLLVDGRPIHGDPGLPAVTAGLLRPAPPSRHHAAAAAGVARPAGPDALGARRPGRAGRETFDIKADAILPVVNLARWAALSVGSAALPTTERLRAASGSAMLPDEPGRRT